MTQEEKQLLLNDLCARLPHYTMVLMGDGGVELLISVNVDTGICNGLKGLPKPYLRPMSSMAEEEKEEEENTVMMFLQDFYNAHHLDYRGLIEKGLAIEAPEGMYKIE